MQRTIENLGAALATATALLATVGLAQLAHAQGECSGGACGTPYESGGTQCTEGECVCEGGICVAGSILIANTDMGDTYQYADDFDIDGWEDEFDNCPFAVNADQIDADGDGFGDACDNCPGYQNAAQSDADGDLLGDACDEDADNDGLVNALDSCPLIPNPGQLSDPASDDSDGDRIGNVCDPDDDNDGLLDAADPCPLLADVSDRNDDRCDRDGDDDGIPDSIDLCPLFASDDNGDGDGDQIGDACDGDLDNDGVPNLIDNCRTQPNPGQLNADRDGFGDACDPSFCFVVDSPDSGRCLNPAGRFFGRPGPDVQIAVGELYRLRIFTNRPGAPTQFAWKVVKAPAGVDAHIENPAGTVAYSSPWEFHYQ
ncbi:MAG: thrombospondin type 3 repeat-containing protein, partial [Deltaproteobacteria bacterium]|nr:thrombospondin type 3 repeat-containing protein [Deltaproteobacteria bacterium]